MKRYVAITTLTAVFLVFAGFAFAQQGGGMHSGMQGGGIHDGMQRDGAPGQQSMMSQGMASNMRMMSQMMDHMHQLMMQGEMSGENQRQMAEMMDQMGQMMQQMTGPHDPPMEQQHSSQLMEMQKRLDGMKNGM